MSTFHNPYHFVPVAPLAPPEVVPLGEFAPPESQATKKSRQHPHLTHDSFVEGTQSGRIICKVTVETPLICGSIQEERPAKNGNSAWTKLIHPFELIRGIPAIPGSSLRGMISAIAEAASQSALRVLENQSLSYRRQISEGPSAIGLVVERGGALHLFPMAQPHYQAMARFEPNPFPTNSPLPADENANYSTMFPTNREKVYFGDQRTIDSADFLRDYKTGTGMPGGLFYGVRSASLVRKIKDRPNHRNPNNSLWFWLGQQINKTEDIKPWEKIPESQRGDWTCGILRVLGKHDERREALPNKKHEYFLPLSEAEQQRIEVGTATVFPIEQEAITRFNQLADERAEAENEGASANKLLPYTPNGANRGTPENGRPITSWKLKEGDIVFFRPSSCGNKVVEVSLSSVWRGRVEENSPTLSPGAPVRRFFGDDLSPLSPDRIFLTLAEQLFGVVEIRDNRQKRDLKNKPAFAFASRLRISNALLTTELVGGAYQSYTELLSSDQQKALSGRNAPPDIPLQNLASPKPPSPAMYFKPKTGGGGYVAKKKLNPNDHAPQGRKFYLRRAVTRNDDGTYTHDVGGLNVFVNQDRLRDADERNSIVRQHVSIHEFVRPGTTFEFHLDFDNLTELELGLLSYSLQPSDVFRHQIGHGKPFGLGQIQVEPIAIQMVDRQKRYAEDALDARRWHTDLTGNEAITKLAEMKQKFTVWANSKKLTPIIEAIKLIGTPPVQNGKVHYPQTGEIDPTHPDFQSEHYHWFVQNDDTRQQRVTGQFLRPLIDARGNTLSALPQLDRFQQDAPPSGGNYQGSAPWSGLPPKNPVVIPGGNAGHGVPPGCGEVVKTVQQITPDSLAGKIVPCKVDAHETVKHKLRIRFAVPCGEKTIVGYLANPNVPNTAVIYPIGKENLSMKVLNPLRVAGVWQCQLQPV